VLEAVAILSLFQIPTKCVATPRTLNIAAKIVYIDFEGRSDNKSVKELLEKMKPRQLVR